MLISPCFQTQEISLIFPDKINFSSETKSEKNEKINSTCKEQLNSFFINDVQKAEIKTESKRKYFSKEEDHLLQNAVIKYNYKDWNKIASFVPGKTSKQCRDRWTNYLHPSLKFEPWTSEEIFNLISLVKMYGTHWSKMKKSFPNRSSNSLKNQWHSLIKSHGIQNASNFNECCLNKKQSQSIIKDNFMCKMLYSKIENKKNRNNQTINEFENIDDDDNSEELVTFTEDELDW